MKPSVNKHSVTFAGHMTSASFEKAFWDDLKQIAKDCDEPLSQSDRQYSNLSSPSRLFVLGLTRKARRLANTGYLASQSGIFAIQSRTGIGAPG